MLSAETKLVPLERFKIKVEALAKPDHIKAGLPYTAYVSVIVELLVMYTKITSLFVLSSTSGGKKSYQTCSTAIVMLILPCKYATQILSVRLRLNISKMSNTKLELEICRYGPCFPIGGARLCPSFGGGSRQCKQTENWSLILTNN